MDINGIKRGKYYIDKVFNKYNKNIQKLKGGLNKCGGLLKKKITNNIENYIRTNKKDVITSISDNILTVNKKTLMKGGSISDNKDGLNYIQSNILNNIKRNTMKGGNIKQIVLGEENKKKKNVNVDIKWINSKYEKYVTIFFENYFIYILIIFIVFITYTFSI